MEEKAKDISKKFDINLVMVLFNKTLEEIKSYKRCEKCTSTDVHYESREWIVGVDYYRKCKKCGHEMDHHNYNHSFGTPVLVRY